MNLFSQVKGQVSILDVIGHYTQLKKAGSYFKGCCPFHHEKTASFTVSPQRGIFYCFGCHKTGDVINFIESIEQCSVMEAVDHLIEQYGLNIDKALFIGQNKSSNSSEKTRYFSLCGLVAQWCNYQFSLSKEVLDYCANRVISRESASNFSLGYFPKGFTAIRELMEYVQRENFLPLDLVEAGIINQQKNSFYSPFEDRIIFPIKDHLGRVCGFGGRIFKPGDDRAKYYNSRENNYFTKGNLLFGLDRAKLSMQKAGSAFLVEGYTDCIAMAQHGFANTVATLGTACTIEHLKQLSRYVQQLYVVYDSDNAGTQAILRLTSLCWQVQMDLQVIRLPDGQDPASFLANKNDFATLVEQSKNIFLFFIEMTCKDFTQKPLAARLSLTRNLLEIIGHVEDSLTQALLMQRASNALDIPVELLQKEIKKLSIYGRRNGSISPDSNKAKSSIVSDEIKVSENENIQTKLDIDVHNKLEKKIFFAIINNVQLFNNDLRDYLLEYLPEPFCGILDKLKLLQEKGSLIDFAQFFDSLNSYEKQTVSKILMEHEISEDQNFDQLLLQFHKKNWKTIVQEINRKLEKAKQVGDSTQESQLVQQFLTLKKNYYLKPPINGGKI